MRINDIQYELIQDCKDKKITARSARSTRTHCGKAGAVKFPSDYLSNKEIKAMSGECVKYASLKKPMTFDDFKVLPNDLKKEYLVSLRTKFNAPDKYIAEMLGVSSAYLSLYLKDLGMNAGKFAGNGNKKWKKEEFYAWLGGADMNTALAPVTNEETPVEAVDIVEEVASEPNEPAVVFNIVSDNTTQAENFDCSCEKIQAMPYSGQLNFNCPADQALNTLALVLGNSKVELAVHWRIVSDTE